MLMLFFFFLILVTKLKIKNTGEIFKLLRKYPVDGPK